MRKYAQMMCANDMRKDARDVRKYVEIKVRYATVTKLKRNIMQKKFSLRVLLLRHCMFFSKLSDRYQALKYQKQDLKRIELEN